MALPQTVMPAMCIPSNASQGRIVDEECQADKPRRKRRQRSRAYQGSREHSFEPEGLEHADKAARSFTSAPELIVASPFLRA